MNDFRKKFVVEMPNFCLSLGKQTKIMGVINLTPDSFSQDGILSSYKNDFKKILSFSQMLVNDGADIIDVGGESTRPGSQRISIKEEVSRVIPTVKILASKIKVPISVDTYKATVARYALDNGANIINNIMGTNPDVALLKMIARYKAAIVIMHIRGIPMTMQKSIHYKNLMKEVTEELTQGMERCLENGIKLDKIIVDPGIGFGKNFEHNMELINRLDKLRSINRPILVGPSRKSFIGHILNVDIKDRLFGTIASVCACITQGAHIVRVHDVKAVKQAVAMMDVIMNAASTEKS